MKPPAALGMPWRRYIREIFVLTELAIIFLIIAFLLVSTVPGLLRVRKRSQTSKMVTLSRSSNRLATV
jgi:competence protein ComGC